jgi:hypothetical protein
MSQKDSQKRTIGGHRFEVFKLPPFDAQDVLIDIGQVLAPALGKAVSVFGSTKADSVLDIDIEDPRISTAIGSLAQSITKDKMRQLVTTMASVTHCDGTPLPDVMEIVFRGDLPLLYKWLWFSLVANFGNFTDWLGGAIKGASGLKEAAQSLNTSKTSGRSSA